MKKRNNRPIRDNIPANRINNYIRAKEVRLVGDNLDTGIYTLEEAKALATDLELDLVEISPNANPPVCKVMDYKKFLYEKKRKEKEMKAKASKVVVKELRFTPNTDEHDLQFKTRHAENFLKNGAKVKAYVQFKGRNITFKEKGEIVLLQLADKLSEIGTVEQMPKLEGRRMIMFITPKK